MSSPIPTHKPDYYLEVLDDEILLYHPARTTIFHLNQTAALIWQLCDGRRAESEIVALLIGAYPHNSDDIARETSETLQHFQQQGIIDFV